MGKSVEPGDLVADKYRVERVIGKGAMGLVLAAVDTKLGKRVALKCLLPHAWGNAAAVARFEREARASVALESEHACRVLDVGRMPDGAPFIAMELLDGLDLAHELHRRGGRLPIAEAVTHVIEACDAISEAHARGIVHRDLKPSNLFLAKRAHREPIIKVLDFGISKPPAVGQMPSALTGTADLLGTPLYMSPEQLRAPKTVDARSDIWSLAATLYELACGKPPFEGATIADLSSNIMNAPAPDVRKVVMNAPAGFADVIVRALAKSRDARYPTVDDFARALAPFGTTKKTAPMPAIPAPLSSTKMLTAPMTPRDPNRTLPLPPRRTATAPAPAPSAPAPPASDPGVATKAAGPSASTQTMAPPPLHSLSGPLGLFGSIVAVITIVVVIALMRTKDESTPSKPIASASASGTAVAASPIESALPPTSSVFEGDASSSSESEDAAIDAALVAPTVAPQAVRPSPSTSASADARVFESAGY